MTNNRYRGEMTRREAQAELTRLAGRLHIEQRDVRVSEVGAGAGAHAGADAGADAGGAMRLAIVYRGVELSRTCSSQRDRDTNLVCLVLWLRDLVRNVERRIETLEEAFYAEGGNLLPATGASAYGETAENLYEGDMSVEQSLAQVERSLSRLGLGKQDIRLRWDDEANLCSMRLKLRSGRVVEKVSTRQRDARRNLAALSLWLRARAKNFERGIETDVDKLFAGNLLPQTTATAQAEARPKGKAA